VTYRFDKKTTVAQLHKDACAYWACSPQEYVLCRVDKDDCPQLLRESDQDKPLHRFLTANITQGPASCFL